MLVSQSQLDNYWIVACKDNSELLEYLDKYPHVHKPNKSNKIAIPKSKLLESTNFYIIVVGNPGIKSTWRYISETIDSKLIGRATLYTDSDTARNSNKYKNRQLEFITSGTNNKGIWINLVNVLGDHIDNTGIKVE